MVTQVTPAPDGFEPDDFTRRSMQLANYMLQQVFPPKVAFVLLMGVIETDPVTGKPFVYGARTNTVACGDVFTSRESVRKFLQQAVNAPEGHEVAYSPDEAV